MSLPELPYTQKRKEPQITTFAGVNYRESIKDGELQFSENMSSRRYPWLSPRRNRVTARDCAAPSAVWAGDKLVLVDNSLVYYGDNPSNLTVIGSVGGGPKQFAAINSKLVIWPDKMYIDLTDGTMHSLEASVSSESGQTTSFTATSVTLTNLLVATGKLQTLESYDPYSPYTPEAVTSIKLYNENDLTFSNGVWTLPTVAETDVNSTLVSDPSSLVGKCVMVQNGTTALNFKKTGTLPTDYADNSASGWYAKITAVAGHTETGRHDFTGGTRYYIDVTYEVWTKGTATDLTKFFTVGDAVTIQVAGEASPRVEKAIIRSINGVNNNVLNFDNGTISTITQTTNAVTVSRDVPNLDYICASENRLWGVSNADGGRVWDAETQTYKTVHNRVIYASSLGDPTNFFIYDGLSTDGYAVAVAGPGDFTGCVGFSGDALFFKENRIFRIYGDYPASYTMYTYDVPGVAQGSHLSVGIINDVLYYLAKDGVHAWSGGESSLISYRLGPGPFSGGMAGVWGTRYYLSMRDGAQEKWSLHVYDALHNVWYREDEMQAYGFAEFKGNFYLLYDTMLAQADCDAITTTVTETVTYYAYQGGGPLAASDLSDWAADKYYGLTGLSGVKFLIPQKTVEKLTDHQNYGMYIRYDTRYPDKVTFDVVKRLVYWRTVGTETVPAIDGDADETVAATETAYQVTVEKEETETATWVTWKAVLADADEVIHQRKNYRWLRLRMVIPAYSTVRVYVSWDGSEDQQMWESTPEEDFEGTVNIPLPPNRADKIRITLSGTGDMTLKSVIRAYNVGSVNTCSKGAV